ncbi:MAG: hypothetical protein LBF08_06905 [Dysgonamonadaceae bacterium]|jgi:hypothetical protein|nr:hypothetical protein [Dysgonamonadaceae bacterium]
MNNNNLLASVALFGELYNTTIATTNGIGDILADFIKGAVINKKIYSLNSTELKDLLLDVYNFNIPESVIRTIVKNRLKNCVTIDHACYHFDATKCVDTKETIAEINKINQKQEQFLDSLCSYLSKKSPTTNNQNIKEEVRKHLSDFLMNNGNSEQYSELISSFIIAKENDNKFKESLNTIKEGLVLYQGLCYSEDINQLGAWHDELTIYLSPEHLFNFMGYNGLLFKGIFDDFMSLVKEINRSEKGQNKKGIIRLKYLEETKNEIDNFFGTAESIKRGQARLDCTKPAMNSILKDCNNISDVKTKQAKFYTELKQHKIALEECFYSAIDNEYNIVDTSLIEKLKIESNERHKNFNENDCIQCLQIFTKINYFRKGKNNSPFEKIRHIYLTENKFALYLGHNNKVKFADTDITFATDIDYIISKIWFKLKKGFNDKNNLPKTFDVLTKARIIMSSRINNSLAESYDKLQHDLKEGKLTEGNALILNDLYKDKPSAPEQINSSNIDDALDFLNNPSYIEDFFREKSKKEKVYQEKIEENELLKEKLASFEQKEKEQKEKKEYEELEKKSIQFARMQWKKEKKVFFVDIFKTLFAFVLVIASIVLGSINIWIESLCWRWVVVGLCSIFSVIDALGRAYLFNKEKIKNGWRNIIMLFKYKSFKKEGIEKIKNNYIRENRKQNATN